MWRKSGEKVETRGKWRKTDNINRRERGLTWITHQSLIQQFLPTVVACAFYLGPIRSRDLVPVVYSSTDISQPKSINPDDGNRSPPAVNFDCLSWPLDCAQSIVCNVKEALVTLVNSSTSLYARSFDFYSGGIVSFMQMFKLRAFRFPVHCSFLGGCKLTDQVTQLSNSHQYQWFDPVYGTFVVRHGIIVFVHQGTTSRWNANGVSSLVRLEWHKVMTQTKRKNKKTDKEGKLNRIERVGNWIVNSGESRSFFLCFSFFLLFSFFLSKGISVEERYAYESFLFKDVSLSCHDQTQWQCILLQPPSFYLTSLCNSKGAAPYGPVFTIQPFH